MKYCHLFIQFRLAQGWPTRGSRAPWGSFTQRLGLFANLEIPILWGSLLRRVFIVGFVPAGSLRLVSCNLEAHQIMQIEPTNFWQIQINKILLIKAIFNWVLRQDLKIFLISIPSDQRTLPSMIDMCSLAIEFCRKVQLCLV